MLTEKYKINKLEDVRCQDTNRLKNYVLTKIKKPLLIYGPSGTGKTSSIYALAKELDYEIIEANASNFRNKDSINSVIGAASHQASLFKKGKIILIDELEGFSGNSDRGGIKALLELAEETSWPIIATTTEIDNEKIDDIKNKFILLEFKRLDQKTMYSILEDVCKKENISHDAANLNNLIRISNGDARLALINLEIASINNKIEKQYLDLVVNLAKDNVDEALLKIFKSRNLNAVQQSINSLKVDLVDLTKKRINPVLFDNEGCFIYALEENLPYEYDSLALCQAFNLLSKASIFHSRISRWQYYRYLVYINMLLASVSLSKKENNPNLNLQCRKTSRSPKNNKKLWFLMNKRKKDIAEKIAVYAKTSNRKIMKDFPYYKMILRNNPIPELSEEEIDYLNS